MAEQIIKIRLSEAAEPPANYGSFLFHLLGLERSVGSGKASSFFCEGFQAPHGEVPGHPSLHTALPRRWSSLWYAHFPSCEQCGVLNPWSVDEKLPFHYLPE